MTTTVIIQRQKLTQDNSSQEVRNTIDELINMLPNDKDIESSIAKYIEPAGILAPYTNDPVLDFVNILNSYVGCKGHVLILSLIECILFYQNQ